MGRPPSYRYTCTSLSLQVPRARLSTFASCAFSVFGPSTWNDLPLPLRQKHSLDALCAVPFPTHCSWRSGTHSTPDPHSTCPIYLYYFINPLWETQVALPGYKAAQAVWKQLFLAHTFLPPPPPQLCQLRKNLTAFTVQSHPNSSAASCFNCKISAMTGGQRLNSLGTAPRSARRSPCRPPAPPAPPAGPGVCPPASSAPPAGRQHYRRPLPPHPSGHPPPRAVTPATQSLPGDPVSGGWKMLTLWEITHSSVSRGLFFVLFFKPQDTENEHTLNEHSDTNWTDLNMWPANPLWMIIPFNLRSFSSIQMTSSSTNSALKN